MTAMAIGAVVSAAQGINSNQKGKKASGEADDFMSQSIAQGQKQFDILDALKPTIDNFAKQGQDQFDKYQDMFGPLEESLNDYYSNLNPDDFAAQGNQTAQMQYQKSMNQVNDQLAAQGIQNSGIGAQQSMQYGTQMAQTKAQNIMDAPGKVAEQQAGWMNYGAGRQDNAWNQMQSGVGAQSKLAGQYNDAYSNMSNLFGGAANSKNSQAQGHYNAAQGSASGAGSYLGMMS